MDQFLDGAVVMGFAVAGLLFLSCWRRTRQTLFLTFAASFCLLGVNFLSLTVTEMPVEERSPPFLVRLLAFGPLIVGSCSPTAAPRAGVVWSG